MTDSSLIARRLGEVEQFICTPHPATWQPAARRACVEDLRGHDCFAYQLADYPGSWHLEGPLGTTSIEVPARFSANNSLLLSDMLLAGMGIGAAAVVHRAAAADARRAGQGAA
ncbi:LysR substrate-binding domain-containing protein [Cupriavidus basilensis]